MTRKKYLKNLNLMLAFSDMAYRCPGGLCYANFSVGSGLDMDACYYCMKLILGGKPRSKKYAAKVEAENKCPCFVLGCDEAVKRALKIISIFGERRKGARND